jgi:putative ABC transport system ATP-binding protein
MTASQAKVADCVKEPDQDISSPYVLEQVNQRAIVARDISMVFRSGSELHSVLQNIDLEIEQGDIQLLMGPSGSGKTTLLSILAGILTPTSGRVWLLDQEITAMSREELSRFRLNNIGFIFQGFNLFPALTAAENVEVALRVKGVKGVEARRQAVHLLDKVKLANKVNRLPRDLSGGEKQRVAIARALAGDPSLIMADEPTASLDIHNGHAVIELLRQLAKEANRTVLIVTHDPRLIDVADKVIHLEDGVLRG